MDCLRIVGSFSLSDKYLILGQARADRRRQERKMIFILRCNGHLLIMFASIDLVRIIYTPIGV